MYASVTTLRVQPDQIEEAIRIGREEMLPGARQHKGFVSYTALVDRATGKVVSISFWETEEDLLARNASGAARQRSSLLAPYLTAPPVSERLEVVIHV